jgi:hypothetical protein
MMEEVEGEKRDGSKRRQDLALLGDQSHITSLVKRPGESQVKPGT